MAAIQTQKKDMSWRQSKWSTIAEYNDQFLNLARVAEACDRTIQIPGVINIVLKDKHSGFSVSQLNSTAKEALNNEVCERVLLVLYIENSNRRIYYELLNTLKNDYIMGQDNYPRDMATSQKLLLN